MASGPRASFPNGELRRNCNSPRRLGASVGSNSREPTTELSMRPGFCRMTAVQFRGIVEVDQRAEMYIILGVCCFCLVDTGPPPHCIDDQD